MLVWWPLKCSSTLMKMSAKVRNCRTGVHRAPLRTAADVSHDVAAMRQKSQAGTIAGRRRRGNAGRAGVDVHFIPTQEADERLAAFLREFHRQAARGGDGGDNGH